MQGGRPRRPSPGTRAPIERWYPALGAAGLLGAVVVVGAVTSGDSGVGSPSAEVTTTVAQVVTESTTAPVQKLPLTQTYGRGATGPEIKLIQDRLIELSFDPGTPDGVFGERTQRAIWAFEKLVMGVPSSEVTGKIDAEMWSRMQDPIVILPRRPDSTPNHTEIYLPEQVMVVFHGDRAVLVTHVSSGDNQEWCEEVTIDPGERGNETGTEPIKEGWCGLSWTPGGVYKFNRMVAGRRESQLGGMYNPVYFNYGIAVHGAQEVPTYPASHGCIRIPMHISDYFQSLVAMGDQVFVFDGVKEPEEYGSPPPRFNWRDPNYTTTTSTTTSTTTPPTTTIPVTTIPATTVAPAPPSVTSTTSPPPVPAEAPPG